AGIPLTGNVTFTFFTGDCTSQTSVTKGTIDVDASGVAHPSQAAASLAAGNYAFQAHYNGDANYNASTSGCEPFSVGAKDTGTSTTLHAANHDPITNGSSVALGSSIHDSATVTGAIAGIPLTGNVTFTFFTGDCTSQTSVTKGTIDVDASGVAHPSQAAASLAAGNYAFQAHYNGDANYNASTSGCEPFSVGAKDTGTSTTLHAANHDPITNGSSVALGSSIHDSATVTGAIAGIPLTGNVTFTFFTGDCTSQTSVTKGTIDVDASGVAHPSQAAASLAAGNYAFQAHYNGDANYNASTSGCEPFSVGAKDTGTSTTLHAANHDPITNGSSVALGSSIHDSATVTGAIAGIPLTGNVTFTFFTGDCTSQTSVTKGTIDVDASGVAHPSQAAAS